MSEAVTPLTQSELDELVALEKKATPGPWRSIPTSTQAYSGLSGLGSGGHTMPTVNTAFIADLRNAAPALLAEVVASRARIAELEAVVTAARKLDAKETGR